MGLNKYWSRAKVLSRLNRGGATELFEGGFNVTNVNPQDEELYQLIEKLGPIYEDFTSLERKLWQCAEEQLDTPEPI
jgi:hypothetical protein